MERFASIEMSIYFSALLYLTKSLIFMSVSAIMCFYGYGTRSVPATFNSTPQIASTDAKGYFPIEGQAEQHPQERDHKE